MAFNLRNRSFLKELDFTPDGNYRVIVKDGLVTSIRKSKK